MRTNLRFITVVIAAAMSGAGGLALAQTPAPPIPEPLTAAYACRAIATDAERLACYDQAVGRLQQAQQEGAFAAVDAASVRQLERESFGFSLPSLPRLGLPNFRSNTAGEPEPAVETLTAQISRVIPSQTGRNGYVMSNGQVWRQVDTESNRQLRSGAEVTIRRATLGSFLMTTTAGGPAVRVRREQ
jgi:hypothetical protein